MADKTVETKVEQVDVNIDEIFSGAPGGDSITLPEEEKKPCKKCGRKPEEKKPCSTCGRKGRESNRPEYPPRPTPEVEPDSHAKTASNILVSSRYSPANDG